MNGCLKKDTPFLSKIDTIKRLYQSGFEDVDAWLGWVLLVSSISIYLANTCFRSSREGNE